MTDRGPAGLGPAAVFVGIAVVVGVVALGAVSIPVVAPLGPGSPLGPAPSAARSGGGPSATPSQSPVTQPPGDLGSVLTSIGVFLACLVILVLVFLIRGRRRAVGSAATGAAPKHHGLPSTSLHPEPDEVVGEALGRLRSGTATGDEEIIRCWRAIEAAGDWLGVTRQDSETVGEYVVDLAYATRVDVPALDRLAELYRAAVFSDRASGAVDRDDAITCLDRLLPGLERR